MIDVRKDIVFRDENYKTKFTIKDGDSIKITVAYDGVEIIRKCRFIDETHMYLGTTCFHMDEFMEKSSRVGNKYEPVPGEPKLDILFVEQGQKPRKVEIPLNMAALSELVGGELDLTPLGKNAMIVHGVTGGGAYDKSAAFAICGVVNENLTSLHPYWAQTYTLEFEPKEPPLADVTEKKTSLLGRMAEAKKTAETMNQKSADKGAVQGGKKTIGEVI